MNLLLIAIRSHFTTALKLIPFFLMHRSLRRRQRARALALDIARHTPRLVCIAVRCAPGRGC